MLVASLAVGCASSSKPACVVEHLKQFNIGSPGREITVAKADGKRIVLKSDANGLVVMPAGETFSRMSPEEKERLAAGQCSVD